jgi:hypothetical protein
MIPPPYNMEPEDIARLMDEDAAGKIIIKMKPGRAYPQGKEIVADAVKRSNKNRTIYVGIGNRSSEFVIENGKEANRVRKNPFNRFARMTAPGETISRTIEKYKRIAVPDVIMQNLLKNADWHRTEYVFKRDYDHFLTLNPDNVESINGRPVDQWEG